jgi:hypothetical protein
VKDVENKLPIIGSLGFMSEDIFAQRNLRYQITRRKEKWEMKIHGWVSFP